MSKIDAVITWVDGDDPYFIQEKEKYTELEKKRDGAQLFGFLDTRFKNVGELEYCIRLIRKHLNFIRKIFLVTNGQVPSFLSQDFYHHFGIKFVFHNEIFKDFEDFLPVFNSHSIEAMLVRIPNLTNKFLYFNDDFFISNTLSTLDFFKNDSFVYYGVYRFKNIWLDRAHRFFDQKFSVGTVGFRNESKEFPLPFRYFSPKHVPYAIDKKIMEKAIQDAGGFKKIISYRFRNEKQPWPIGMFLNEAARQGRIIFRSPESVGYFHGAPNKKFDFVLQDNFKFFSAQSLDRLSNSEKEKAIQFLKSLCQKK